MRRAALLALIALVPVAPAHADAPRCTRAAGTVAMPAWQFHLQWGIESFLAPEWNTLRIDADGGPVSPALAVAMPVHLTCVTATGVVEVAAAFDVLSAVAEGEALEQLHQGWGDAWGPGLSGTGIATTTLTTGGGYATAATVEASGYWISYTRTGTEVDLMLSLYDVTIDPDGAGPDAPYAAGWLQLSAATAIDWVEQAGTPIRDFGVAPAPATPVVFVG